ARFGVMAPDPPPPPPPPPHDTRLAAHASAKSGCVLSAAIDVPPFARSRRASVEQASGQRTESLGEGVFPPTGTSAAEAGRNSLPLSARTIAAAATPV